MYIKSLIAAVIIPDMRGNRALMQCLQKRESVRQFGRRAVSEQILADMLWAAVGVNRQNGKRTIPTALNSQDLTVYVIKHDGAWQYDAKKHKLIQVSDRDLRPLLATQDYAKEAALDLVYVSTSDEALIGAMHAGSAYQNVGLYCACKGLNNVVRGYFDKEDLAKALNLCENQQIMVTQAVGWPAD